MQILSCKLRIAEKKLVRRRKVAMSDAESDDESVPELIEVPGDSHKVIPVTILSGFLGSGKTTLLNHILTQNHGKRIAVIENEFGEGLGIESMIAKSGVDGNSLSDFFELGNGCICCTVKDNLVTTLEQLVAHRDRFDYILIETTGLANPGPVVSALWTDDIADNKLRLDGVVCVVDCLNIGRYLQSEDIADSVKTQLCYADRILLNKVDLVEEVQVQAVRDIVSCINSYAQMETSTYSKVNLDFVLNTHSYATTEEEGNHESGFIACLPCAPTAPVGEDFQSAEHENRADSSRLDAGLRYNTLRALSGSLLNNNTGSGSNTAAGSSHIPSDMRTHYLRIGGAFDLHKLKSTLDALLYSSTPPTAETATHHVSEGQKDSEDSQSEMRIFRMKGLVHVHDNPNLHILQAVHTIFDVQPGQCEIGSAEDTTQGESVFVVIGRHLDMERIEEKLLSCVHRP